MKPLKRNRNAFFLTILFLLATAVMHGQERPDTKVPFGQRLVFGGNIGLQFGRYTFVDISPLVGYKVTDQLIMGLGATYIYYSVDDFPYKYSTNIFGGRTYTKYYLMENLFAHVEYEILNMEVLDDLTYKLVRTNIPSLFVGGGYRQMMGQRSAIELLLLYNLMEERNSPYQNPIIRAGFVFGF
jgi:hypothetical protein